MQSNNKIQRKLTLTPLRSASATQTQSSCLSSWSLRSVTMPLDGSISYASGRACPSLLFDTSLAVVGSSKTPLISSLPDPTEAPLTINSKNENIDTKSLVRSLLGAKEGAEEGDISCNCLCCCCCCCCCCSALCSTLAPCTSVTTRKNGSQNSVLRPLTAAKVAWKVAAN
jgi:hypothetical protein